jgi:DNA-binding CsgD family transcriptional regulator
MCAPPGISPPSTVKFHVASLRGKLGASSSLVAIGMRLGLLPL